MAATVGDLVVRLGAVTAPYNSKMQQARGSNTKFGTSVTSIGAKLRRMGATASRIASGAISRLSSGLGNITRKALGFAAALVGVTGGLGAAGLGLVLKNRIEEMDALTKAARALGSSTEEFGRIGFAAEQLGGIDTTQFIKGIRTMVMGVGEIARLGTGEALNAFGAAGLDLDPAELARLSPGDMILELADAFGKLDSASAKVDIAGALFGGRNAQGFINLLGGGRAEIVRLGDEIERLGGLFSEEVGQGAERANDAMNRLRTSLGGLATQAATELAPFIEVFSDRLTNGLVDAKGATGGLTSEFGLFGEAVLSATKLVQDFLVTLLRTQAGSLDAIIAVREVFGSPFGVEDAAGPFGPEFRAETASLKLISGIAKNRAFFLERQDFRGDLEDKVRTAGEKGQLGDRFGLEGAELDFVTAAQEFARKPSGLNGPGGTKLSASEQAFVSEARELAAKLSEESRQARIAAGPAKQLGGIRVPVFEAPAQATGPRFAGAVEKSSTGAFSALVATLRNDPKKIEEKIEKNTRETAKAVQKRRPVAVGVNWEP